jgi:uncharacterized protein (TIGR00251 family)
MAWSDALTPTPKGSFIHLHVTPNSDTKLFPGKYHPWRHTIDIHVKSPAKDNQANEEVIETLSTFFKIPKDKINIVKGHNTRQKTIHLDTISVNKARKILGAHMNGL